jgi:hypothetical protein
MIRTHLETGPRILLSPGEVLAPFYITQNTRNGYASHYSPSHVLKTACLFCLLHSSYYLSKD